MVVKHWAVSTKDGLQLKGKNWLPDTPPKYIICLVHGHGEHIGRYEAMARFFAEKGMATYAIDMRGHGKSEGKKGHIPNYEMIFSDIEELIKRARVDFLETPIVLYGHSLGGNYAANYIIHHKTNELQSLVLSSPWLKLAFTPPDSKIRLAKIMRKIWPSYREHSKLDATGLSTDEKVVQDYLNDPLVHDQISVSLFTRAIQYGAYAITHAPAISIPVLIMHGEDDPITDFKASKQFYENRKQIDLPTTFKGWPHMKHETHHEIGHPEVLNFVSDWVLQH